MAKRANPDRLLAVFQEQVNQSLINFLDTCKALSDADVPISLLKQTAEDAIFRLAALWEVFLGRWFVAAISKAPERFIQKRNSAVSQALKDAPSEVQQTVALFMGGEPRIQSNLKVNDIAEFLDPTGRNIAFSDPTNLKDAAILHLSDPFKLRAINLCQQGDEAAFLRLLIALRNALAHGSESSMKVLNSIICPSSGGSTLPLQGKNTPLAREARNIRDIGKYLQAMAGNPRKTRVELIHSRLLEVSSGLRSHPEPISS